MKRAFLRKGALGAAFLLLTALVLTAARFLLVDDVHSYSRVMLQELYGQAGQIDTLFLGSSHCYRSVDPSVVDETLGTHSFNAGSSQQLPDGSYTMLREAAAQNSLIPVINAGDGGHNHPTQTLADILTIYREKGRLNNLTVGFCGDLKYGRTVHSLIEALAMRDGIKIVLISPEELKLPDYIIKEVIRTHEMPYKEITSLEEALPELDVLYMTRIQKERFDDKDEYERLKDSYILDTQKMKSAPEDMVILHPLPRVNEISIAVDKDPRACYFKQVLNGKYMRMALILKLLQEAEKIHEKEDRTKDAVTVESHCRNPKCISRIEQELTPLFKETRDGQRCVYCDCKIK